MKAEEIAERLEQLSRFAVQDYGHREITVTEYRRDSAYDVICALMVNDVGPNGVWTEHVDRTVNDEGTEVETTTRFYWK